MKTKVFGKEERIGQPVQWIWTATDEV